MYVKNFLTVGRFGALLYNLKQISVCAAEFKIVQLFEKLRNENANFFPSKKANFSPQKKLTPNFPTLNFFHTSQFSLENFVFMFPGTCTINLSEEFTCRGPVFILFFWPLRQTASEPHLNRDSEINCTEKIWKEIKKWFKKRI